MKVHTGKVSQQRFHDYYGQKSHNGIDDWQFP